MGAVRIYKENNPKWLFDTYVWQVRSNGCSVSNSRDCDYGRAHGGYCTAFVHYKYVLNHLNDPTTELGAYLKK